MYVIVLGIRGFPGVQGGVETHAQHLYPRLARMGCEIEVLVRAKYMPQEVGLSWKGIRLKPIWFIDTDIYGLETISHSLVGLFYSIVRRPDILHIHSLGPANIAPIARLFGLRVIVTFHSEDYKREKWGAIAKFFLRCGELLGIRFANRCITVSRVIQQNVLQKYGLDLKVIPNGVLSPVIRSTSFALQEFGLTPRQYVLIVGRLSAEKRHIDLIHAFRKAQLSNWKMVIVGSLTPRDDYVQKVMSSAGMSTDVVFTDYQRGRTLQELYTNCGVFVLPSSHEGLPIALLEALSYGQRVLASDIPANREVGLPENDYFSVGDIAALAHKLRKLSETTYDDKRRMEIQTTIIKRYDWDLIALETFNVYKSIMTHPCSGVYPVCPPL
jgi:glycosyltransferase involved in cell wall biosynthesis